MPTEIPIAIVKCKVGPLTARYHRGEYRDVEREKDGKKRVAILGIDNSHNRDFKVAYASDPVLVVHAEEPGFTHDQLRAKLQETNLWLESMRPIEIPTHPNEWLAGFQTGTQDANLLDTLRPTVERANVENYPMREGDNHINAIV